MKKTVFAALAAMAMLSACAKGTEGKDADGNCTQTTISAYNSILHDVRMYDSTGDTDYLIGIKNNCADVKSLIGNGSCKAKNLKTEETMSISYEEIRKVCEAAGGLLEKSSANKNESDTAADEKE